VGRRFSKTKKTLPGSLSEQLIEIRGDEDIHADLQRTTNDEKARRLNDLTQ
jgi:hypothetical protein